MIVRLPPSYTPRPLLGWDHLSPEQRDEREWEAERRYLWVKHCILRCGVPMCRNGVFADYVCLSHYDWERRPDKMSRPSV